jgi:hypothetical protein
MAMRARSDFVLGVLCLGCVGLGAGLGTAPGCGGKAVMDGSPGNGAGGGAGQGGSAGTTTTHTSTTASTTTWTNSTTTWTNSTTTTASDQCQTACQELFDCTQVDNLCPGMQGANGPAFIEQCVGQCQQNPALTSVIDPQDCAGTIATLSALNASFDALCHQGQGG